DRVDLEFDQLGLELASTGCCGGRRRVLHGVTGSLRAGRVAAVMGPSGAGKTTLLNVLSGRWDRRARLSGRVRVNGDSALSLKSLSPLVAFVPQEDIMCRELTVRELLEFSAAARLPAACTQARRRAVVNDVLRVLKLVGIRHAVVGDELRRGISGGQRKRVNVGMELVADPSLLFADEPTSGLDSATSLDVMHAFHDVARRGATVAVVLHQPSMQIYAAFDDVLLLAAAGRTAYLGAPSGAKKWFTSLGIRFPSDWAPPDYFMQILA
ncbi:P-loop containing nucleoside triphosphate hydrolase protein, partial [Pelagophyceae sp. CCMP2097]